MNTNSTPEQRRSLTGARLRKHADFQRAYAAARKRQSASMSWFLAPQLGGAAAPLQPQIGPRVGLTVGKVLGQATERNRIKRRMREALRRHRDRLPEGFDLIFHPRRTVLTIDFVQLEAEIVRILEQAQELAQQRTQQRASTDTARTPKLPAAAAESRSKPAS